MSLLNKIGLYTKSDIKQRNSKKSKNRTFKASAVDRLNPTSWGDLASINQDIKAGGDKLLARSKDAQINSDYGKNAIRLMEVNTIPPGGMKIQIKAKDENNELLTKQNREIEEAFEEFSDEENFTVTGRLDRYRTELLMMKHFVRDGEFFAVLRYGKTHNKFGIALQPLNPRMIDTGYSEILKSGRVVSMGIEFNTYGKITAFYIRKPRMKEEYYYSIPTYDRERIPAEKVIYDFDPEFADQKRGYTHLVQSLIGLKKIDGYEEYGFIAAQMGAAKMGYYYSKGNDLGVSPSDTISATDEEGAEETDENGNFIWDVEPGQFEQLPPGWEMGTVDWQYPHEMHKDYMSTSLKGRGAGLGIDYPSFANDWEGVNYTSARMAQMAARENYLRLQNIFANSFNKRVYKKWLLYSITADKVSLSIDDYEKFSKALRVTGKRWQFVDPDKEAKANKLMLDNKMKSYRRYYAEQGLDFEEEMKDYAEDIKIMKEDYGIIPGDGKQVDWTDDSNNSNNSDSSGSNGKGREKDYEHFTEN